MMAERPPALRLLPSGPQYGCAHAVVLLHTGEDRAWWACRDCRAPFAPAAPPRPIAAVPGVDGPDATEYVSLRELCRRIPYREGTIRNLMSQGHLQLGVHYVKPHGGRIMFRMSAIDAWLAGRPGVSAE
jgi:Helix-turn-helix domain